MPRYKITLEYEGSAFVGWQRQENGLAVQQVVEEAFFRFTGCQPTIYAAGRTDAGVHAAGQVIHVDLEKPYPCKTVLEAGNFHLKPHAVSFLAVEFAARDFHARFSAIGRIYEYYILNRLAPPALKRGQVWWVKQPLDISAMQQAATCLMGKHDFTSFRALQCQALSPIKTIDEFSIHQTGDVILCTVKARSFLHHQVRNMVGTLKMVGDGKWPASKIPEILAAKNRAAAGVTAPSDGLYLTKIIYPQIEDAPLNH